MRLYEKYFADIDALTDETVAGLKAYHEETRSLVKYYNMDIPQDVCKCLNAFDSAYSDPYRPAGLHPRSDGSALRPDLAEEVPGRDPRSGSSAKKAIKNQAEPPGGLMRP